MTISTVSSASRKPWVIANWKMNPTSQSQAITLIEQLAQKASINQVNVIITPSNLHLATVKNTLNQLQLPYQLAGQNLCAEHSENGAYTGETSATQLADIGAEYVLIGHSERRQYYAETDAILVKKIHHAFAKNLSVIFCIGETHEQYLAKQTFEVISQQLNVLAELKFQIQANSVPKLLIAYEPVWAIGTGLTPTISEIETVHQFINEQLNKLTLDSPVLYGGSVNANNVNDIASISGVDGVLVGGASLNAESFYQIIEAFAKK